MRPRLLFVESTPEIARAVAAMLDRHEFEVLRADHHRRAAERLQKERFDLLLVEIKAAAGDPGLEFLRHIRDAAPHYSQRIVVISNDPPPSLQSELDAVGICDMVSKPIHEEEILQAIRDCLDRSPALVH